MMKYSYNDIMEPWYPEEFKVIDMKPIKKNTYAISNYGRVISINYNRILNSYIGNEYRKIHLCNEDGTRTSYQIHVLVAYHFIPRTIDDINNNRNIVNHKNLITTMNYVHNLKSAVFRPTNGQWIDTKGSKNGMSRLTEDQVHIMCSMLEKGYSYSDICIHLGLEDNDNNRHLLTNLVERKRWKHISKDYNLPKPHQCINFSEYIIPVCELLEKGLSNKEIVKILQMKTPIDPTYRFINRIRNRKVYSEITKNYNF